MHHVTLEWPKDGKPLQIDIRSPAKGDDGVDFCQPMWAYPQGMPSASLAAAQGAARGCGYDPCGYRLPDEDTQHEDTDTTSHIETGDIVHLVSGSPAMTVLSVCDECGDAEVAWFDGDSMQYAVLPDVTLLVA